jgi:peptidoglycan LD-endopeptidase LytH
VSRTGRRTTLAILALSGIAFIELASTIWRPPRTSATETVPPASFPRRLIIPIQGISIKNIRDTFNETRGIQGKHEATDILAPRGTPVLAVDDGVIKKLFLSKPGGITIYQFDPTEQYCYYYAHLDHYADGIHEGMKVQRGDVIGYVGSTGNASPDAPHLHFAIFVLGPGKRWWEGTPINPYPILMAHSPAKLGGVPFARFLANGGVVR